MMDERAAQRENVRWMTEVHRLSLGANRSSKWPSVAGNASYLSQIAFLRPVARWPYRLAGQVVR